MATEQHEWESLFDLGMKALDSIDPMFLKPEWTFGGGTVLMFRYKHRISRDIDIFLTDAQYLTLLTPRLNDKVEDLTTKYREDSQHVKLIFSGLGEVDFIVAPRLVHDSFRLQEIRGRKVKVDKPEEIIAKKCFYRACEFTARDVFDLAVFLSKDSVIARKNLDILLAKKEDVSERLVRYRENPLLWERDAGTIRAHPGFDHYRDKSLKIVSRFYDAPEKTLESLGHGI